MKMDETELDPHPLPRSVTLVLLLALAAAAWAVLVWHHRDVNMDMASPAMSQHAALFLAMWVVMMVAMMFPTAAPMILAFQKAQAAKRQPDDAFVSTWVFVTAYLLVWALAGIAAYAGVLVAEIASVRPTLGPASAAQFGGAFLMIAGAYQLTPLKEICLSECRTPIVMTSWHDDAAGAFRMGLLHGLYCLGCCWLLFLILFPLGMNVGTMAVVTLIIFAEKMLPWPTLVRYTGAVVLVLYGALVIASPQLTFPKDGSAAMPAEIQMKMPGSGSTPAIK
jgi:predicted metal-binding membrane protein